MIIDNNSWHMKVARSVKGSNKKSYTPKDFCHHSWTVLGAIAFWLVWFGIAGLALMLCGLLIFDLITNPLSVLIAISMIGGILLLGVGIVFALITYEELVYKRIFSPIGTCLRVVFTPFINSGVFVLRPFRKTTDKTITAVVVKQNKKKKIPGFFSTLWETWHKNTCFPIEIQDDGEEKIYVPSK